MADGSKGTDRTGAEDHPAATRGSRAAERGQSRVKAGANAVRSKIATLVWLAAVVCALFLAVGALLIALDANTKNPIVDFVISGAETVDLWFSPDNGIFTFADDPDGVKSALTNWGIAAVVYLVVGKLLDRIIRP